MLGVKRTCLERESWQLAIANAGWPKMQLPNLPLPQKKWQAVASFLCDSEQTGFCIRCPPLKTGQCHQATQAVS